MALVRASRLPSCAPLWIEACGADAVPHLVARLSPPHAEPARQRTVVVHMPARGLRSAQGVTGHRAGSRRSFVGRARGAARISLPEKIARPWTYEQNPRGDLGLVADRERGVLIGAWAVASLAGEWIHHAALAIKTGTPLDVLRDTVAQFPTSARVF